MQAFAEDIPIDLPKMGSWTREQAAAYFESGGAAEPSTEPPPPPPPSSTVYVPESALSLAPARTPTPLGRKPRIAFLHGTAGNEAIFRVQLGPLVRVLREMADLYFIEGSFVVGEDNEQAAIVRQFFGESHTLYEYARPTTDERQWRTYAALDAGIEALEAALADLPGGGADALIGFSQGANLITCLCACGANRAPGEAPTTAPMSIPGTPTTAPVRIRAAVLLSPASPGWAAQRPDLFSAPLLTPSLVAYSETDPQVCSEHGCGPRNVALLWAPAVVTVFQHSGPGHRPLPVDLKERDAFVNEVVALLKRECPA